jgi:hypothetical protein
MPKKSISPILAAGVDYFAMLADRPAGLRAAREPPATIARAAAVLYSPLWCLALCAA